MKWKVRDLQEVLQFPHSKMGFVSKFIAIHDIDLKQGDAKIYITNANYGGHIIEHIVR